MGDAPMLCALKLFESLFELVISGSAFLPALRGRLDMQRPHEGAPRAAKPATSQRRQHLMTREAAFVSQEKYNFFFPHCRSIRAGERLC